MNSVARILASFPCLATLVSGSGTACAESNFRKESLPGESDSWSDDSGAIVAPFELRFDFELGEGQRETSGLRSLHPRPRRLRVRPDAPPQARDRQEGPFLPAGKTASHRPRGRSGVHRVFRHRPAAREARQRDPGPLSTIGFGGGDDWSPRQVRFFDIQLIPKASD